MHRMQCPVCGPFHQRHDDRMNGDAGKADQQPAEQLAV
jgi:sarcosine oxidase delta subunit